MVPLIPLGWIYRRLMNRGGAITPIWEQVRDLWSWQSWHAQLSWIDPVTLASKQSVPFLEARSLWLYLAAPVLWFLVGIGFLTVATWRSAARTTEDSALPPGRGCWMVLAALLILGGTVCPDTLGPSHGNYLPQRVVLLGLLTLVPALDTRLTGRLSKLGAAALAVALLVQWLTVWDYAGHADRLAAEFQQVRPLLGRGQRVAFLDLELRQPFRANPLLHLDGLLGLGNGNILWNNYETAYYYFPVQVRPGVPHPSALDLERISLRDDPASAAERAAAWHALLARHHAEIDVLVVRGSDPARLDPITARWFPRETRCGLMRVLRP